MFVIFFGMASKDDFRCPVASFDPDIDDYVSWKKEAQLWDQVTDVQRKKRGPTIFYKLKGRAKSVIDDLENPTLGSANGFDKIIEKLDDAFLPDEFEREFWPLHDLFTFKKTADMSMENYLLDDDQERPRFIKISDDAMDFKMRDMTRRGLFFFPSRAFLALLIIN